MRVRVMLPDDQSDFVSALGPRFFFFFFFFFRRERVMTQAISLFYLMDFRRIIKYFILDTNSFTCYWYKIMPQLDINDESLTLSFLL